MGAMRAGWVHVFGISRIRRRAGLPRLGIPAGPDFEYNCAAKSQERKTEMKRRLFLKSMAAASTAALAGLPRAQAALPAAKITRVRIYQPPNLNQLFNQSNMLCTVETDAGLTGIGEGGSKDTLEQCAGSLIGKNPFQIETLWQRMYMEWFYPPGREKIHALGALDMALWDIKGKAFQAPVHQLLNGSERDYMECYPTGGVGGNVLVYNLTPVLTSFDLLNGDVPISGASGLIGDLRFTDTNGDLTGTDTCGTVQCLLIFYVFDSEGLPADVGPVSTSFLVSQTPGTSLSNGLFTYPAGVVTYDGSIVPEPTPVFMLTFGMAAFLFIHKRSKAT